MPDQKETCDIRIWCEECQRCDYTIVDNQYFCTSCDKLLHRDNDVHQAQFTVINDDKDKPS